MPDMNTTEWQQYSIAITEGLSFSGFVGTWPWIDDDGDYPLTELSRGSRKINLDLSRVGLIPVSALISSASVCTFIWMLQKGNTSTLVSLTYPLSLTTSLIIGHVLKDEKLSRRELVGIIVSIVACVLLLG